eukprot:scaffold20722_cov33-Tisochrysis_lutea.AAC.6
MDGVRITGTQHKSHLAPQEETLCTHGVLLDAQIFAVLHAPAKVEVMGHTVATLCAQHCWECGRRCRADAY